MNGSMTGSSFRKSPLPHSQATLILQLKEKLHKSFMELSDVQKICRVQLEVQKQTYQARIQELQRQNRSLSHKILQLETLNREKPQFILANIDQSYIEPPLKKGSSSFINQQTFCQLLRKDGFNSKTDQLMDLEGAVRDVLRIIPRQLNNYFMFATDICYENGKIRDQLFSANKCLEMFKKRNQELKANNQELKKIQKKIKQDNQRLAQMYREQVQKAEMLSKLNSTNRSRKSSCCSPQQLQPSQIPIVQQPKHLEVKQNKMLHVWASLRQKKAYPA